MNFVVELEKVLISGRSSCELIECPKCNDAKLVYSDKQVYLIIAYRIYKIETQHTKKFVEHPELYFPTLNYIKALDESITIEQKVPDSLGPDIFSTYAEAFEHAKKMNGIK